MSQTVIENPIINSPFDEPGRRFCFADAILVSAEKLPEEQRIAYARAQTLRRFPSAGCLLA
jgi:hypothetical protein